MKATKKRKQVRKNRCDTWKRIIHFLRVIKVMKGYEVIHKSCAPNEIAVDWGKTFQINPNAYLKLSK